METINQTLSGITTQYDDPGDAEYEAILNREPGDLTGFDCPDCLNRGYFWRVRHGEKYTERCRCMNTRAGLTRLKKSGLEKAAANCTLKNFEVSEPWQRAMLDTAKAFLGDRDRQWMMISGQSGCGKTHICTATAVRLLKAGAKTRYIQWTESARQLSAAIFDEAAYEERIVPLKRVRVLYIDDLFKTQNNKPPTDRDFTLAFELLNARYNDPSLITIISTEHALQDLSNMDVALAGRIAERCGRYYARIKQAAGRNYRERFLRQEV